MGEASHLIGAGGIPGFGDQLRVAKDWILGDAFQQRRIGQDVPVAIPPEYGGEVETEAVDMHLHDPVAQRIENQITHDRVRRIDRVSCAREVTIEAFVVVQPVVDRVVDSAKRDRGSEFIAFDRVVEHHIQDHLDIRPGERLGPSP